MNTDYRYQLDSPRVTGRRQQKTTCPQCGRQKCFVRYVDTRNDCCYLSDNVGRCDHEQSCGYHYRPSEYFKDHPWMADSHADKPHNIPLPPKPAPPLYPLPMNLVEKSHSAASIFWRWLSTSCAVQIGLSAQALQKIFDDYLIGADRQGNVIFWQIDEQQRVRSGHIMRYAPDGHRQGYQGWAHARMLEQGLLPSDYQLQQCFFGQHLLPRYPTAHVCLVESEKTAVLMAARHPNLIWLATCGSSGLNINKLEALRGRRFTLFPDSGCFVKWKAVMEKTTGLQYNISEDLEQYPPNTDLADILLEPSK